MKTGLDYFLFQTHFLYFKGRIFLKVQHKINTTFTGLESLRKIFFSVFKNHKYTRQHVCLMILLILIFAKITFSFQESRLFVTLQCKQKFLTIGIALVINLHLVQQENQYLVSDKYIVTCVIYFYIRLGSSPRHRHGSICGGSSSCVNKTHSSARHIHKIIFSPHFTFN